MTACSELLLLKLTLMVKHFSYSSNISNVSITFSMTGSGELEFSEFVTLAAQFLVEEDAEEMQNELKEAFRLYDKEGIQLLGNYIYRPVI